MSNGTNTFNTSKNAGIIAKAAAMALVDELQFTKSIAKADESDYNGKNGYSAGDTIYISKQARFIPNQTFDATNALLGVVEEKVPLVLDTISSVPVGIDSLEFATTFQIKQLIKRVIKPGVQAIASDIEARLLVKAKNLIFNQVGTFGSTSYDTDTILSAREKMNKFICPKDDNRFLLLESTAGRLAVGARKGLFQDSAEVSKQYKNGAVGKADGFTWLENELLPIQTNGSAATVTVTTTSTEADSTIALTSSGSQTLTAGTRFTIANVYAVHPLTKTKYPFLQQFVVTALNTASGGAHTAVKISPSIYAGSAGLQNVDSLPQSAAAVTIVSGAASGSYQTGLAFHKHAFRMVSAPLVMPTAVEFAAQETYEGITVAIVRAFDVYTRKMVTRMDVLVGLVADRPEWACEITA